MTLLVAGGGSDPNLIALLDAARRRGVDVVTMLVGADRDPWIAWDLPTDTCLVDGALLSPRAAFVRHDVFGHIADPRPEVGARALSWWTTVTGWLACHPEVRTFNRHGPAAANKPHALWLAASCGLAVPPTLVANHHEQVRTFAADGPAIAKPVTGGGLCRPLDDALAEASARAGVLAAPAIVQPRLRPPEIRVYAVADALLAFSVDSAELDYRATRAVRVAPIGVPAEVGAGLRRLCAALRLDFAAADFKTCPDGRALQFLEINTGPMFAAFDAACDGRLCDAMLSALLD